MLDGHDPELFVLPDGRRTQLWQGGDPRGRAVVFFHGCPDTRHAALTGDEAARGTGVRLVAVNRPGYGSSDPDESSLGSVADDVVAVLDALGIGRFGVLGMSIGGPYALACAARYPERVFAAAVLAAPGALAEMDPPVHRDDLSADRQAEFARLAAGSVAAAVDHFRPGFEQWVAEVAPDDPDDQALAQRWTDALPEADAALVRRLPVSEIAASAREALAQPAGYLRDAALVFRDWGFRPEDVGCPTRLWYGDLDANAPVRNGRWLADRIPGATLVVCEQTTHLATLLNHWDDVLAWFE